MSSPCFGPLQTTSADYVLYPHRMPMPYNIILSSTHYIIIRCEFHHIETTIAAILIISFKIIITIIIFLCIYTLKYYVLALWPRPQTIISLSTIMLNAFCGMVCFSFRRTVAAVTLSHTLSSSLSLFSLYGFAVETGAFCKVFPLFFFISFTLFTRVTLPGAT